MPKSSRSHSAFLREIRTSQGLTGKQADSAYKSLKTRLGRDPLKADIARHPRMTRDAVKAATYKPPATRDQLRNAAGGVLAKQAKAQAAKKADRTTTAAPAGVRGTKTVPRKRAAAVKKVVKQQRIAEIRTLEMWLLLRPDLWEDAEWHEYHCGGEYEYTPHG